MSEELTKESFDPYLNDTFTINFEGGESIELELVTIEDQSNDESVRFALIFKGPEDKTVVQNTYTLDHPEMGKVVLFMVPIAAGRYESLFNRIKE